MSTSSVTPSGTDATAAGRGRTTATRRREGAHTPRNARRKPHNSRVADLKMQLRSALELERQFHLMALEVEAELAEVQDEHKEG